MSTHPLRREPGPRDEEPDCPVSSRAVPALAGREFDTIWQRHSEFMVPFNHLAENSGAFIQRDNVQLIKQQKLTKLKKLSLTAALNLQIPPANFFLNKGNNQSLGQNRTNVKCLRDVPACRASHVQGCGHRLPVPAGASEHPWKSHLFAVCLFISPLCSHGSLPAAARCQTASSGACNPLHNPCSSCLGFPLLPWDY